MEDNSTVIFFLDEDQTPIAEFVSPVHFDLDTRKMVDGKHSLKIISKDPTGQEGIWIIPFEVKNGPAIAIEGISENANVSLMTNAYGQGNQKRFLIKGSEKAQSTPAWIWILLVGFLGWAVYYIIRYSELINK